MLTHNLFGYLCCLHLSLSTSTHGAGCSSDAECTPDDESLLQTQLRMNKPSPAVWPHRVVQAHQEESRKTNKSTDLGQGAAYTVFDDWWAFEKCPEKEAVSGSTKTNRKPVMWVHLHKAAGTAICCEARRREKVIAPAANCNHAMDKFTKWQIRHTDPLKDFSDKIHGANADDGQVTYEELPAKSAWPHTTCEKRLAYMQEKGFTWGAIERWLGEGDLCPHGFVYATLLREPLSTMISEANFNSEITVSGRRKTWLRNVMKCIEVGMWCEEEMWYVFDNFMVRTFSGIGFTVPPGGVNSSHLHAAIKVLRSFDLVLLWNRLDDPRTPRAFERTIGWPFPLHVSNESARVNKGDPEIEINDQIISRLTGFNEFDFQLLEFAEQTYYL